MLDWFMDLSLFNQTLIAGLFTWLTTSVGAASVLVAKKVNLKIMDGMLGFAGGVMIAASFWSLLSPAISRAEESGLPGWLPAAIGFLVGAIFLWAMGKLIPHMHAYARRNQPEGYQPEKRKRSTLLILAVTLHNIPEGLAIGVAFGAVASAVDSTTALIGASTLALGIGLQNIPEGAAISLPLRREGMSRFRSFFYGQFSGMVEPISAIVGFLAVTWMAPTLPYALSFAAGAMIFVVVEEVIPGSQENGNKDMATMWLMIGFVIMMILDVALG
ncbi:MULTISPECIES: ZIP family metal transporter [Allobacillus]|uniref:ZIP family metal transporter n=1 Tax=Allobacillus halotolerans TaxID=570278 RepID=A0ABS6GQT4_9BACI|nr:MULTISPECIES: ZIP family metal transporter [Allobacillus]MBU6081492.1 ZIP family metal transporter [Allobacillus halotolerans]TSJ63444.1 ZIP family metal transporter [Allobacillus sp. SKP2-8]